MLSCIIEQEAFKICKFPDEFLNREWSYRLNSFQKQRMSKERKQIKTLFLTLLSIKAASVRSTYAWRIFKEKKTHKGIILYWMVEEYQINGKHYFSTLKSPLVLISEDRFHCLNSIIMLFWKENLTSHILGKNSEIL